MEKNFKPKAQTTNFRNPRRVESRRLYLNVIFAIKLRNRTHCCKVCLTHDSHGKYITIHELVVLMRDRERSSIGRLGRNDFIYLELRSFRPLITSHGLLLLLLVLFPRLKFVWNGF